MSLYIEKLKLVSFCSMKRGKKDLRALASSYAKMSLDMGQAKTTPTAKVQAAFTNMWYQEKHPHYMV